MAIARTLMLCIPLIGSLHAAPGEVPATPAPRVDKGVRALIDQAVIAIVRNDQDLQARIEALRDPGIGDRQAVLIQLALLLEGSNGTEQSMAGAAILHQLGFTPEEKLQTILPHLDAAGPGLRRVFTEILSTIDRPDGGEPDFSYYEGWIRQRKDAPPGALIRYLYQVSPDMALASMERVYGGGAPGHDASAATRAELRRLLALRDTGASWSTKDRESLVTALDSLSRDPGWFRRLYAATILVSNPDLAGTGTAARLKSDGNSLVRETLPR